MESNDERFPIELRTHTRLWQVEKKLYKLYDYTLPMPVSIRMLGIFILVSAVWITVMVNIGVPFAPPFGHIIWLFPPAALTWAGSKPVAEGKRLGELITSQVSFMAAQPKQMAGLRPHSAPERIYTRVAVWRPFTSDESTPDGHQ